MAKKEIKEDQPITTILSKHWLNFFNKFNEIDNIKVCHWKEIHVLGYMVRKYEQVYKRKYSITISKGAPSKCPDMWMVKNMIATLNTSNMNTIKQYVDWVFDHKIISIKRNIRSFGYFNTIGFANDFYAFKKQSETITRSTVLPKDYKDVAEALDIDVATFGDLAFIKLASDRARGDFTNPNVQFLANLEALGLDLNVLEELKQ